VGARVRVRKQHKQLQTMANLLFDLPFEIQNIIFHKKHQMETKKVMGDLILTNHKKKSKKLMDDLIIPHERIYCSGCGENVSGYATTFYKKDLKTYITLGEYCCINNENITRCKKEDANFKQYDCCYNTLEEEDEDEDDDENRYYTIRNENEYNYGYN